MSLEILTNQKSVFDYWPIRTYLDCMDDSMNYENILESVRTGQTKLMTVSIHPALILDLARL